MYIGRFARFFLGMVLMLCAVLAFGTFYLTLHGRVDLSQDYAGYYCRGLALASCIGCAELWHATFQKEKDMQLPVFLTMFTFLLSAASALGLMIPITFLDDGNIEAFVFVAVCAIVGLSLIFLSNIRSAKRTAS